MAENHLEFIWQQAMALQQVGSDLQRLDAKFAKYKDEVTADLSRLGEMICNEPEAAPQATVVDVAIAVIRRLRDERDKSMSLLIHQTIGAPDNAPPVEAPADVASGWGVLHDRDA